MYTPLNACAPQYTLPSRSKDHVNTPHNLLMAHVNTPQCTRMAHVNTPQHTYIAHVYAPQHTREVKLTSPNLYAPQPPQQVKDQVDNITKNYFSNIFI